MRFLSYIFFVLFLCSCDHSSDSTRDEVIEHSPQEDSVSSEQNQDDNNSYEQDDSLEESQPEREPELVIHINREKARLYNTSMHTIAKTIRESIIHDNDEVLMKDILNERLIFRNNKGQIINIPLKAILDTIYVK